MGFMSTRLSFLKKINSWKKKGRIIFFKLTSKNISSHFSVPVSEKLNKSIYRIYFSSRDRLNRSNILYCDYDLESEKIIKKRNKPILSPGKLGAFDDSGVTPTCILNIGKKKYLYYVGWRSAGTTRMSLNVGLAILDKNKKVFKRYANVPMLERSIVDPYLTATLSIIREKKVFKMWYVSGDGWTKLGKDTFPKYNIKYAYSYDGINWIRDGIICIDYENKNEFAIAKPSVIKLDNFYIMYFCSKKYGEEYKLKMAISKDGKKWSRQKNFKFDILKKGSWERKMNCYPHVVNFRGFLYMFYNGNNYGKTGIGLATLKLD